MESSSRSTWASALCCAVALAAGRTALMALQDGFLVRGFAALAGWSAARGFLAGLPWALVGALVAVLALRRARSTAARAAVLAGVLLLGFAFATCRLPSRPVYVPALWSARGWLGNAAGLAVGFAGLAPLVWAPLHGRLAGLVAVKTCVVAAAAYLAIPLLARAEEPPPFPVAFEDVTAAVGIDSMSRSWAIAWGDFDGDGRPEPWLTNHGVPQLYRNVGARFERVPAERSGAVGGDLHGAAWADFDGDGDQDLLELAGADRGTGTGASHLYVSEGERLVERAGALGLDYPEGRGRSPLWLDWDGDGALDALHVCGRREGVPTALFLQRAGAFVRAGAAEGFAPPEQSMFAQLAALTGRGSRHLLVHAVLESPQQVVDLTTSPPSDVTARLAVPVTSRSEDVVLADLDGDLATDLFVARRRIASELQRIDERTLAARLLPHDGIHGLSFRSDGALTVGLEPLRPTWWDVESVRIGASGAHPREVPFRVEPREAEGAWTAVDVGDLPGKAVHVLWDPATGRWEVRVHGSDEEAHLRLEGELPITDVDRIGFSPQKPVRNAVYLARGGGFEDVTDRALALRHRLFDGLPRQELLGFGTECASLGAGDFDNDMDVDVYAVCSTEIANLENVLFENLGDGRFRALPGAAGAPGTSLGIGDGVAVADYDLDGFLDLLVSNGRGIGPSIGPLQLYRNRGNGNHWLQVDLEGTRSNREGIGAQVFATAGGRTQVRFQGGGVHRAAQDFRRLHFGLGPHERVDELVVLWPSGAETRLTDLAADRIVRVVE